MERIRLTADMFQVIQAIDAFLFSYSDLSLS